MSQSLIDQLRAAAVTDPTLHDLLIQAADALAPQPDAIAPQPVDIAPQPAEAFAAFNEPDVIGHAQVQGAVDDLVE